MEALQYPLRVRPRASVSERGEALEAVGRGQRLTNAQILALQHVGYSISERPAPPDRPWGDEDRIVILRLARTRGWSALAISVFLRRPEAKVQAILSGAFVPESSDLSPEYVGRPGAHRHVPRLPRGIPVRSMR